MLLNESQIKHILDELNSVEQGVSMVNDYEKFIFYNGSTREIIKKAISKEFKNQEMLDEMCSRLVPINVMKKVIDKQANTYLESPVRSASTQDDHDIQLINNYETETNINYSFKIVNRYFKLNKKALFEVFVTDKKPKISLLPSHTYRVFSFDEFDKTKVTCVVKIINENKFLVWTDEETFFLDKNGTKTASNKDGTFENVYGKMPFVYVNESIFSVNPIQNDDLFKMAVCIPVLLTDLLFAIKYQCFSVVYTVGANGDIPFSPNSVVDMDFGPNGERPVIDTVKPNVDADKVLTTITYLMDLLLTTNSLKSSGMGGQSSVENIVSGVSKMLDSAESIEDKKDQHQIFYKMENDFWNLILNYLHPYWLKNNMLIESLSEQFSDDLIVDVNFSDPAPIVSESEKLDNAIKRLDNKLSTQKIELQRLYPDYDDAKIMALQSEIKGEEQEQINEINDEITNDLENT